MLLLAHMVFSSPIFLFFFLPAALLLYFISPKKLRNVLLLAISLLFYAWGEGVYVVFLIFSIIMNYGLGLLIGRSKHKWAKAFLVLSVVGNLLMLGVFKYAGFFVENLNTVINWFTFYHLTIPKVRLPIGISFFTFQALSYVIDVYRGKVRSQKNILNLGLYISLFPQLIAGPIVRYKDIRRRLENRKITLEFFSSGVSRFVLGLGKKVIIANTLAQVADSIFVMPVLQLGFSTAWLAIICYTFQIYFDFSGYSDMAIGLGRMFGFRFFENFRYPYISQSIREFWRRWHISLSSWFRDYLYIPLGGSRKGKIRTYINLMTVFILCGFWHGASWNFVFWGFYYGFFLVLERVWLSKILKSLRPFWRHVYALTVIIFGWVFFRIEVMSDAFRFLGTMLGVAGTGALNVFGFLNLKVVLVLIIALVASTPVAKLLKKWTETKIMSRRKVGLETLLRVAYIVAIVFILLVSVTLVASDIYNPFIYFRF